jgi:hypothetical protein
MNQDLSGSNRRASQRERDVTPRSRIHVALTPRRSPLRLILLQSLMACLLIAVAPKPRTDREQILDAVLTDPAATDDYGTPGDRRCVLVSETDSGIPWPTDYQPRVPGFVFLHGSSQHADRNSPRRLGIRIDCFDLTKPTGILDAPVMVTLLNAGGSRTIIGGCLVSFTPQRQGNRWIVHCNGSMDP